MAFLAAALAFAALVTWTLYVLFQLTTVGFDLR